MYNELRKKAEKRVQAKMGFYVCAIVFTFTTAILLGLSFYIPAIVFWLMLPIPVFMMVLAILYLSAFGSPSTVTLSEDWKEEEGSSQGQESGERRGRREEEVHSTRHRCQ